MFRNKIKCNECEHIYDALEPECPECKNENPRAPKGFSRNAVILPLWLQLTLLGVGYVGLQLVSIIVTIIATIIFTINNPGATPESATDPNLLAAIEFISYGIITIPFIIFVILFRRKFKYGWKNWQTYVFGLIGGFALIGSSTVYMGFVQVVFGVTENANEQIINQIVSIYPVLSLLIFAIVGPVVEELTYRVGLFSFLRRIHPALAYAVTIIFFAILHFDVSSLMTGFQSGDFSAFTNELLNFPAYLLAAAILTFIYDKFGFGASCIAHITNNFCSVLLTILALRYGH